MIIGIDPGKSGAVAVVSDCKTNCEFFRFDKGSVEDFWRFLALFDGVPAVIEKVHATPQMGVTSSHKFGKSIGHIEMAAIASGLDARYVSPQRWQKELGLVSSGRKIGQDDTAKKNRNKAEAQRLFPAIKVIHAIADALLLAEYGFRTIEVSE